MGSNSIIRFIFFTRYIVHVSAEKTQGIHLLSLMSQASAITVNVPISVHLMTGVTGVVKTGWADACDGRVNVES